MGTDKALLPHPDKKNLTFIEYLLSLLTSLCQETLLVARNEEQAASYTPFIESLQARIITDHTPDVGPLMGLYSGLQAIQFSHALVTAVDMPYVQPAMIAYLLSQPLTDDLIVPIVNSIPQVLLAVYPRSVLPLLEERLQQGRRDPRSLLEVAKVCYIEEAQLRQVDPQLRSFVNVNTPDELTGY
jgi:molybdopterin-guanine dinucleotide biosynthesis protein A